MTLKNDNDNGKKTECALGFDNKDVREIWTNLEAVKGVRETLDKWEREGGVLFDIKRKLTEQNGRIRDLESFRWKLVGISLAAGVIGSVLWKIL